MDIRPWAEFASDLADGPVEGAAPWASAVGHERVAEAVQEILNRRGCKLGGRERFDEHGWGFEFIYRKRLFFCRVFRVKEAYVLAVDDTSVVRKALGLPRRRYAEILTALARGMGDDPRFRDVRWYFDHQVLTGGPGAKEPAAQV